MKSDHGGFRGLGSEQLDHKHNYPEGGAGRERSLSALLGKPCQERRIPNSPCLNGSRGRIGTAVTLTVAQL